jgi:hypothetical protein
VTSNIAAIEPEANETLSENRREHILAGALLKTQDA